MKKMVDFRANWFERNLKEREILKFKISKFAR